MNVVTVYKHAFCGKHLEKRMTHSDNSEPGPEAFGYVEQYADTQTHRRLCVHVVAFCLSK